MTLANNVAIVTGRGTGTGALLGDHRMRVATLGTGAIGGYYGARLAHAGEEVVFVGRGAHLQALKSHGLRLKTVPTQNRPGA